MISSGASEKDWNRRYDEAMQWRDWQTCDQLLEERETADWYRGERRTPFHKRVFRLLVRMVPS